MVRVLAGDGRRECPPICISSDVVSTHIYAHIFRCSGRERERNRNVRRKKLRVFAAVLILNMEPKLPHRPPLAEGADGSRSPQMSSVPPVHPLLLGLAFVPLVIAFALLVEWLLR
jgi:hypothetical protein